MIPYTQYDLGHHGAGYGPHHHHTHLGHEMHQQELPKYSRYFDVFKFLFICGFVLYLLNFEMNFTYY